VAPTIERIGSGCACNLMRVLIRLTAPKDLLSCNLLHVDDNRMWEEWLLLNGVKASATQTQMMLEDRHFQLSSTINGLGVSLFASWLVQD